MNRYGTPQSSDTAANSAHARPSIRSTPARYGRRRAESPGQGVAEVDGGSVMSVPAAPPTPTTMPAASRHAVTPASTAGRTRRRGGAGGTVGRPPALWLAAHAVVAGRRAHRRRGRPDGGGGAALHRDHRDRLGGVVGELVPGSPRSGSGSPSSAARARRSGVARAGGVVWLMGALSRGGDRRSGHRTRPRCGVSPAGRRGTRHPQNWVRARRRSQSETAVVFRITETGPTRADHR